MKIIKMKIETKRNTVKTFEPIEIKLTIESQAEFDALWHRLNASSYNFRTYAEDLDIKCEKLNGGNFIGNFWKAVNDIHEVSPCKVL